MIVFDQHAVREVQAVVVPAAAANCVFIEHAQAGHGLARIQNAGLGALHGINKLAGESGDAAQPLQHVQYHPLAGEKDTGVVAHHGN